MIRTIIYSLLCVFFICTGAIGQGINFFEGSWEDAKKLAKKEGKLLFVDGYATWCGPCKRMSSQLFPLESVGDFFNKKFVNVKIDMERGEGLAFRKSYPISAFPTLYFIAPDGELIQSSKGAPRSPEALISVADKAYRSYDPSGPFMKKYEEGDRSYATYFGLVEGLNRIGQNSLKYANEYLRSQQDFSTDENLDFIFVSLTQLDSRIFKTFKSQWTHLQDRFETEELHQKVYESAQKTIQTAIDFESVMVLDEAIEGYAALYPDRASKMEALTRMKFCAALKDGAEFIRESNYIDDPDVLRQQIQWALEYFAEDDSVLNKAQKWGKQLVSLKDVPGSHYLLAMVYVKSGDKKKAIKALEACINKTPEEHTKQLAIYRDQIKKLEDI